MELIGLDKRNISAKFYREPNIFWQLIHDFVFFLQKKSVKSKNAMWLADFDFQTSGWTFSVFLYPNESTESVTSRFPPKMGNSSTPSIMTNLDNTAAKFIRDCFELRTFLLAEHKIND